jgi:drug/metabolite transporter (DMT)-like permease
MGLLNNVAPFSAIVWGQTQIASGLASILNATAPFFSVVVAHFLTDDEKMNPRRVVGVGLGFFGVVLVIGPQVLKGIGANTLAQFAVLGATICYAFAAVFGRRFHRMGMPPLVTATGQVTAATVVLIPLALIVDRPWTLPFPGWESWGAVLGLALLSTALAYIVYFRILATAGATNLLLVTLLIPVTAILLSSTFLGERLVLRHIAGMAILGLGLTVIDGRALRFRGRGSAKT